jgi:hypothetical protein
MYCSKCGEKLPTTCYDNNCPVNTRKHNTDDDSFIDSAIIGAVTDSAIIGGIVGGDIIGGIVGDILDGDLLD